MVYSDFKGPTKDKDCTKIDDHFDHEYCLAIFKLKFNYELNI